MKILIGKFANIWKGCDLILSKIRQYFFTTDKSDITADKINFKTDKTKK